MPATPSPAESKSEEDAKRVIAQFTAALDAAMKGHAPDAQPRAHSQTQHDVSQRAPSQDQDIFIVHAPQSMRVPQNKRDEEEIGEGSGDARERPARHADQEQQRERQEFIRLFFANAPRVHNNCILMEKKQW